MAWFFVGLIVGMCIDAVINYVMLNRMKKKDQEKKQNEDPKKEETK